MSLESLPLELKDKVFTYVLPPDRLNLSRCSTALREAVSQTHLAPRLTKGYYRGQLSNIIFDRKEGWRGPSDGDQYNGDDIFVNLAVGVDLIVRNSPESRQSAIRIRQRLCDRLTVKKVCMINIKYDDDTISFIREMLNNCSFEKATIEIEHIDHFHPSLVPFINEFPEKVFLMGPLSLIPRLLQPLRRINIHGDSGERRRRGNFEKLDDDKLLSIAAAGHARIDVKCESDITEHGLRTLLMNLAASPRNQLIRFLSMYKVDEFLRLLGFAVPADNVGRAGRPRQRENSQENNEFFLIPQQSYHKQYVLWYRTAALLIDGHEIWAVSHHDRATEELRITQRDDAYDDLEYAVRIADGESTSRHPTKGLWNPRE